MNTERTGKPDLRLCEGPGVFRGTESGLPIPSALIPLAAPGEGLGVRVCSAPLAFTPHLPSLAARLRG